MVKSIQVLAHEKLKMVHMISIMSATYQVKHEKNRV